MELNVDGFPLSSYGCRGVVPESPGFLEEVDNNGNGMWLVFLWLHQVKPISPES